MEVPLSYPRFPFSVLFSSRLAFKLLTLCNCLRRLQICKSESESESQRTDQNLPPCSLILFPIPGNGRQSGRHFAKFLKLPKNLSPGVFGVAEHESDISF